MVHKTLFLHLVEHRSQSLTSLPSQLKGFQSRGCPTDWGTLPELLNTPGAHSVKQVRPPSLKSKQFFNRSVPGFRSRHGVGNDRPRPSRVSRASGGSDAPHPQHGGAATPDPAPPTPDPGIRGARSAVAAGRPRPSRLACPLPAAPGPGGSCHAPRPSLTGLPPLTQDSRARPERPLRLLRASA